MWMEKVKFLISILITGTLLTTEQTLLSRNPKHSKHDIELILSKYLNITKFIWLKQGVFNDKDTDGHIDNICCFVAPGKVVLLWTDDETDPQYSISSNAYDILSATTDAKGRKLEIIKLHQPDPLFRTNEEMDLLFTEKNTIGEIRSEYERLPASYVNFYIANKAVVMPTFNDKMHDVMAAETLQKLFPDRIVVPIYSREILLGGGNIHCITQQQPAYIK